ncbi:hypothetical protein COCON_G00230950 [Conger conger]|uniref:Uncharacterized protein n=1 Tax=Conger conger TaxID=82655 RepID=A0A9Q1CVI2_CONCO|nr:hypothetical protein COCON_G00230950 [Conger conger]
MLRGVYGWIAKTGQMSNSGAYLLYPISGGFLSETQPATTPTWERRRIKEPEKTKRKDTCSSC